MAHGAGGKASTALIEGLLLPALSLARAGGARRRRTGAPARPAAGDDDGRLRRQAAALPGRLDRRAGRQRDGQRPRDDGRAAAGADAVADPRGGSPGAGAATGDGGRRRRRPQGRGRASWPGTRRSSSAATRDGMYICTTGLGVRDARAELAPGSVRAGDRILLSGSVGEHGTAIMLARGELGLDADVESDTRPLWPLVEARAGGGPRGAAVHARRDPRGRGLGAQRDRPRELGGDGGQRGGGAGQAPVAGAAELLGIDPMYVANEGTFVLFVAPRAVPSACSARCARSPAGPTRWRSARSVRSRRGWCSSRPPSAGGA